MIYDIANTGNEKKITMIPMSDVFGKYKDIMRRIPDLTKAKSLLGYAPKVKMKEGIELTIKTVKENL